MRIIRKTSKILQLTVFRFECNYEEYKDISYLNNSNYLVSPNKSDETNCTEVEESNVTRSILKKKSIDGDFRVKYKTEICKFWELNKMCKYGDNVN